MQGKNLLRYTGSHTNFGGGRCTATAYRLTPNNRIWLALDGGFGRSRKAWK